MDFGVPLLKQPDFHMHGYHITCILRLLSVRCYPGIPSFTVVRCPSAHGCLIGIFKSLGGGLLHEH